MPTVPAATARYLNRLAGRRKAHAPVAARYRVSTRVAPAVRGRPAWIAKLKASEALANGLAFRRGFAQLTWATRAQGLRQNRNSHQSKSHRVILRPHTKAQGMPTWRVR